MSTVALPVAQPRVLADVVSKTRLHDISLIIAGALFVGLMAQVSIPLGFTPVPLTGQTLAVLVVGTSFGWLRSTLSMSLYMVVGLLGVPWFSGHSGGWHIVHGPTFGYLIGFIVAGAAGGWLASLSTDRRVETNIASMVLSTVIIYAFGVTWLGFNLNVSTETAISLGLIPFLAGDAIKAVLAGLLLPAAWKLVKRNPND